MGAEAVCGEEDEFGVFVAGERGVFVVFALFCLGEGEKGVFVV